MSRLRELLYQEYTKHYARMNTTSVDPRSMTGPWLRAFQRSFGPLTEPLPAGSKILDLGCGTGYMLNWLAKQPNVVPVGVDSSAQQIAVARQALTGMEIHCEDGLRFVRRQAQAFAGIFCFDVLEHIPGEDDLLEWVEAARDALVPGGFFCCRMPNAANLFGCYSRYLDLTHVRCFTMASTMQLLEAAGLHDCRVVPLRAGTLLGSLCFGLETLVHKALFCLTSRYGERVFTSNVCAVGFRK